MSVMTGVPELLDAVDPLPVLVEAVAVVPVEDEAAEAEEPDELTALLLEPVLDDDADPEDAPVLDECPDADVVPVVLDDTPVLEELLVLEDAPELELTDATVELAPLLAAAPEEVKAVGWLYRWVGSSSTSQPPRLTTSS